MASQPVPGPRSEIQREEHIRGFTLLELICVIVILGILVAVAAPKLMDASAFDARGYADELAGAIRESESVARASNCAVQLSIRPGSGYQARLTPPNACANPRSFNVVVRQGDGAPLQGTPPADADVAARATLDFRPNGALMAVSGPTRIAIVGNPPVGTPLIVQIDPASGFVTAP